MRNARHSGQNVKDIKSTGNAAFLWIYIDLFHIPWYTFNTQLTIKLKQIMENNNTYGTPGSMVPKWFTQVFAVLITVLVAVLIIAQVINLTGRARELDDKRTINITAEGKVTASPDLATVNASVVTDGNTAESAQNQNTAKMDKVIAFVKTQGIKAEDIKTQDYSVYPKYDYTTGRTNLTGYTASQTLNIQIRDLSIVGKLLDGLTQNGINQIQNVSYSFENPDDLRQQAREQALTNAKEKAGKLAKAAGVRLGKLVSFSENSYTGGPVPYYGLQKDSAVDMGSAMPASPSMIEPGVQDVTAQVDVVFELN